MSLRARILLIFLLTSAAGALGLFRWMSTELEPRYLEAQEELLVDMSEVMANLIEITALNHDPVTGLAVPDSERIATLLAGFPERPVDAQIYALHKQRVDLRIYVTNHNGMVIFDSDQGRDLGEDYSHWRDVSRTLLGEYGARTTGDDPLFPDGSVMYIAAPLQHAGTIVGVVTVGKPTRNAERFLAAAINRLAVASLIALLSAFLIAMVIYRWVSLPLQRLYDYARDLESGERVPMPDLGKNEIGRIGNAMSDLRAALDGKAYVENYVQSLTHELKSPTAAIRGAAELLGEEMPEEDRQRFIQHIHNEAERLQELVDRMLALAAIENRMALDQSETLYLAELVEQAVAGLDPLIRQKSLRVDQLLERDIRIRGDAYLLRRALDNLLKNAIEFSPNGGSILLATERQSDKAVLSISDEGPGIPEYARTRIFERFYSLQRPDGRKGTGLGLNIVREILALHSGTIQLSQGSRNGTCARITLPAG